ncbi:MAG: oxidoreductase, partial [Pseudarthrobacter sp.]|nr:oxidoreductase [Pseudarthrobacter sp.]
YPLPGHANSGTAALAVEAAAQQGKYEQMAAKLFETQPGGEKQSSQAALFRTFAQEVGLDMAV